MNQYRYLELLSGGPVSRVRLLNHRPFCAEEVEALAREWNSVADGSACLTLVMDCSNFQLLSSEMLGKLILLQRRLKQKTGKLVLSGLCFEIREVLNWTKLNRFFEIEEDADREFVAVA
ncbi:MAG: STAS domain-containing protein [Planctomycetota bacterium]